MVYRKIRVLVGILDFIIIFYRGSFRQKLDKVLPKGMWIDFANNIKMEILRDIPKDTEILKD